MKKVITKAAQVVPATVALLMMSAQLSMVSAVANITAINPGQGYASDAGTLINFILQAVMVIALLLVFAYLVMGGLAWITSGGEKSKTEAARNQITAAVIGLIILVASYAILQLLLGFLGLGTITQAINNVGTGSGTLH